METRGAPLGREPQLTQIEDLLLRARDRESAALVVAGPAGQGKTALLEEAILRARTGDPPFDVLRVRGVESEAELAFAGLLELVRPLSALIDALPAPQAHSLQGALALGHGADTDRFSVSAATLAILGLAAEHRPVLVVVDDLHWIDPPSAQAILFAARRLWREGIVVLVGTRPEPEILRALEGITRIDLAPLDPGDAAVLARGAAPRKLSDAEVEALVAGTGGNPLAIIDAARSAGESIPIAGEVVPVPVADRIRTGVERRLGTMDPGERWAALIAAAAGTRAPSPLVAAALAAVDLSLADLAAAEREGLLRIRPETVEFEHPLSRSAVYAASGVTEQRRAHAVIARSCPVGSSERAWHLAASAVGQDDEAADALESVGHEVMGRGAPSTALRALERAAALTRDPEVAARRLLSAGNAARLAGLTDRARRLIGGARERGGDPTTRADALGLLFQIDTWRAPVATAHAIAAESERLAQIDPVRAAHMLAEAAAALARTGSIPQGVAFAERAHAELAARGLRHDAVELSLLFARVMDARAPEAVEPLCELGVRLRDATPTAQNLALLQQVAWMEIWVERYDEAEELLTHAVEVGRGQAPGSLPMALAMRGELGYRRGRLHASLADTAEAAALAGDFGQEHPRGLALTCQARTEAVLGREEDCRATAAVAAALGRELGGAGSPVSAYGAPALGLLELAAEQAGRAIPHLERLVGTFRAGGIREPGVVLSTGDLIEAYAGDGRREDAVALLADFTDLADRTGRVGAQAIAARCRGILGAGTGAEGEFTAALRLHARTGMPFEEARTLLAFGEWMRREARVAEASVLLARAADAFGGLGAPVWEARAARYLDDADDLAVVARPTEPLSARELQVARVAASGFTTPEVGAQLFLSARTVEAHLDHVYRKLGVRTIHELAESVLDDSAGRGLDIRTLGGFSVRLHGRSVGEAALGGHDGRTVLAVLLAAGGSIPRHELAQAVWPEGGSGAPVDALGPLLAAVDEAIGGRLRCASDSVALDLRPGDAWDLAWLLEEACDPGPRGRSLDETDALLARLSAPAFREWRGAPWLDRIEARSVAALGCLRGHLAQLLLDGGRHGEALDHFAALAESHPAEERWHRGVMRCHAAAGSVPQALRQYHACRAAVRESSDRDPEPETRDLYLSLLRG